MRMGERKNNERIKNLTWTDEINKCMYYLGKPQKKIFFLVVRPLRRGAGGKGPTTKGKKGLLKKIFIYWV